MELTVLNTLVRSLSRTHLDNLFYLFLVTHKLNYSPITGTSPASLYWGIDQSIKYGSTTILSSTAGIVDTGVSRKWQNEFTMLIANDIIGTTLILIATDAFDSYRSATGGVLDNNTGLLTITSAQFSNLKALTFVIGGVRILLWSFCVELLIF